MQKIIFMKVGFIFVSQLHALFVLDVVLMNY